MISVAKRVTLNESELPFRCIAAPGPGQPLAFFHNASEGRAQLAVVPDQAVLDSIRSNIEQERSGGVNVSFTGNFRMDVAWVLRRSDGQFDAGVGNGLSGRWSSLCVDVNDDSVKAASNSSDIYHNETQTLYGPGIADYETTVRMDGIYVTTSADLLLASIPTHASYVFSQTVASLAELQGIPVEFPATWPASLPYPSAYIHITPYRFALVGSNGFEQDYSDQVQLVCTGFT